MTIYVSFALSLNLCLCASETRAHLTCKAQVSMFYVFWILALFAQDIQALLTGPCPDEIPPLIDEFDKERVLINQFINPFHIKCC